jgi:hypothetical protein
MARSTRNTSTVRSKESGTAENVIDTLFRAVLRREPDASGRGTYLRLLKKGQSEIELLRRLTNSREFMSKRLMALTELASKKFDEYNPLNDPSIAKYTNESVLSQTKAIRAPSLNLKQFERAVKQCIAEIGNLSDSQAKYLQLHRERFYEIDCVIQALLRDNEDDTSIMDFGLSINSLIIRKLFPNARMSVVDRPKNRIPSEKFDQTFIVDLLDDGLESIDVSARFDIIVFSEVIEHVLVHPTKVIKFLLKHLNPHGRIILTTPNLFSQNKLQRISQRKNPLQPYPVDYKSADAVHFHIREYCMSEMLSMIDNAGGNIEAFFYSGCWDPSETRESLPAHELSNMCFVFSHREISVR